MVRRILINFLLIQAWILHFSFDADEITKKLKHPSHY